MTPRRADTLSRPRAGQLAVVAVEALTNATPASAERCDPLTAPGGGPPAGWVVRVLAPGHDDPHLVWVLARGGMVSVEIIPG